MKKWLEDAARIFGKKEEMESKYSFRFATEQPVTIDQWIIYIVGERPNYWMITFKCPCGCGAIISLNLLKKVRPRWKFKTKWGKISISPSVWRTVGCRSHFYVRKGRVEWSILEWE